MRALFSGLLLSAYCAAAFASPAERDIQAYARSYRVPYAEAQRQLTLQEAILAQELEGRLGSAFPKTYAGVYIQHAPAFGVVVQTTDGRSDLIAPYVSDPAVWSVTQVKRVRHSMAKLRKTQDRLASQIQKHGLDADLEIDVEHNRVNVLATSAVAAERSLASEPDPRDDYVVTGIMRTARPVATIGGGEFLSTCTSGFSVRLGSTSTLGITTAGHCSNTQSLQSNGTVLPYQSGYTTGSYDIQWHTTPGYTPVNHVWIGDQYRTITGYRSGSAQTPGSYVCKFGQTTGYTCTSVVSNTYRPNVSQITSPAATYVRAGEPNLNSAQPGDSGGPAIFGNTAYGSTTASVYVDAYRYDVVYMPADYIESYGLHILTY